MSVAERIIKNTGWLYAKMGITMFVSLWVTRLVLNSLGQSDFGIFNLVGGAIAMLGFLNVALASATQRYMSYSQGEGNSEGVKTVFNVSLMMHIAISLFCGLLLLLMGFVFFRYVLVIPEGRETASIVVYASLVVSTMLTIISVPYDAALNAHENMRYYAFVGIFESLLKLCVAFACVLYGGDRLILYGVLMACIPLVSLSIMLFYCRSHYPECTVAPRRCFDLGVLKEMTSFAGWNLLGTTSTMIASYGIGIVLNFFFGTLVIAAQGVANQLNGQVLAFSNNLMKAVNPVIAKSEGAGDRNTMLNVTITGCKFSYALIAVFAVPLILEMPYVLKLWLKSVPDYAVAFTSLILVKSCMEQMTNLLNTSISAEGRVRGLHILFTVTSVAALFLGIVLFSMGAAPSSIYVLYLLVFGVVVPVGKLVIMKKNCGMRYSLFVKGVFLPMLAVTSLSSLSGFLVRGLMEPSFLRLVAVSAVSIAVFAAGMLLFGMDAEERRLPVRFLLKAVHKLFARLRPCKDNAGVISDSDQVSDEITRLLVSDEPCMICRYGSVELMNVTNYLSVSSGKKPVWAYLSGQVREWWWNELNVAQMKSNAGFFPNDEEHMSRFGDLILSDTREIDLLGSWLPDEKYLEPFFPERMKRARLRLLEPFWSEVPWTVALEGKKVLVVHPFASLIESQYLGRRKLLFPGKDVLPEFELKTLPAVQSIGGQITGFRDWFEALEYMKSEIDRIDYDICLIGCGAYGFPLAAHVKRSGKKAVHLGGALQLLFGIIGKRWEDPEYGVKEWGIPPGTYSSMINEYWVRPGANLRPADSDKVEGGCYW